MSATTPPAASSVSPAATPSAATSASTATSPIPSAAASRPAGPPARHGWRRLVPGTLFGQVLAALLVGIVAAQLIGAWIVLDDRAAFAERIAGGHAAERVAGMLGALDHTTGDVRQHVLRALDVPPTRLTLGEAWMTGPAPEDEARAFAREVTGSLASPLPVQVLSIRRETLPRPGGGPLRPSGFGPGGPAGPGEPVGPATGKGPVDASAPGPRGDPVSSQGVDDGPPPFRAPDGPRRFDGPPAEGPNGPAGSGPRMYRDPPPRFDGDRRPRRILMRVVLQARLSDGAVVTVRQALPEPPGEQPQRLFGWLAAVVVITCLLAGWIVRRLTRPLGQFSAAATGLARDLDQPPLPERGPREIASAARAFNQMQRDLRRTLETRAQALAAVSHDLRLPLTRVRLRIEQLTDASTRTAIEGDLAEMDRMIGNTLEFLRGGTSREAVVPLDLGALLDSIASDMEMLGAQVGVEGDAGGPVHARPQALTRCLANLIDNARRYGGERPVDVTLADGGATVEIRIADRGPSIPAADRERVFEPYVRLDDSRAAHTGGTGLGLAIARAIARAHGGEVGLADRPGGGLVAWVRLPRTPPADGTAVR